jgi:ADP-ribose pyrophosphatase YjhB (NUDIX family)
MVQDGRIVLVQHTCQRSWYLPGGGDKRGETLTQAIEREAVEEIDAQLGTLSLLGIYTNFYEHKSDHVAVFVCTDFAVSGREETGGEIARIGVFALDRLPSDTFPGTRRRGEEYITGQGPYVGGW